MSINWTAPQSLSFIPNGKLVTFTAIHQAAYTQYVQIIDKNGSPISFNLLGGGAASFPINGTGSSADFFINGSGKFMMQDGMKVQFANSGPSLSIVSAANPNQFFINGEIYGGGTLFVTEDSGGVDYNDTSFVIQWYKYEG
jgi:hypothetical protein